MESMPLRKQLTTIYGWQDHQKRGRTIILLSNLITSFYNIFITGIFYTGFLSMYEIDLVSTGIISFIPTLAHCCAIFSPIILERFTRRKNILLVSSFVYHFLTIIATTLMPTFVKDPEARVIWFCILLFSANILQSLYQPGITAWHYQSYPNEHRTRAAFLSFNQITSSIVSSLILLFSGYLASWINASGNQGILILSMRYMAMGLVMIQLFLLTRMKEYPHKKSREHINLAKVFSIPVHHKRFFACTLFMISWTFICHLDTNLWNYHLLNTVNLPYNTINTVSALYTLILFIFTPLWRRILNRLSWIRTFALTVLMVAPTMLFNFFLSKETSWLYIPGTLIQHIINVGLNLSFANLLYLNMPDENRTAMISFFNFCNYLTSFFSTMLSTFWCKMWAERTVSLFGVSISSVQSISGFKLIGMLLLGSLLMIFQKRLSPEK